MKKLSTKMKNHQEKTARKSLAKRVKRKKYAVTRKRKVN